jgi:hypothetical protein
LGILERYRGFTETMKKNRLKVGVRFKSAHNHAWHDEAGVLIFGGEDNVVS